MPEIAVGDYKIRVFDVPPAGFDPISAIPSKLLHHGFPTRPDPVTEPLASQRWIRAMTTYRDLRFTHITPQFQELPPAHHHSLDEPAGVAADNSRLSYNWSGAVVFADPKTDPI